MHTHTYTHKCLFLNYTFKTEVAGCPSSLWRCAGTPLIFNFFPGFILLLRLAKTLICMQQSYFALFSDLVAINARQVRKKCDKIKPAPAAPAAIHYQCQRSHCMLLLVGVYTISHARRLSCTHIHMHTPTLHVARFHLLLLSISGRKVVLQRFLLTPKQRQKFNSWKNLQFLHRNSCLWSTKCSQGVLMCTYSHPKHPNTSGSSCQKQIYFWMHTCITLTLKNDQLLIFFRLQVSMFAGTICIIVLIHHSSVSSFLSFAL